MKYIAHKILKRNFCFDGDSQHNSFIKYDYAGNLFHYRCAKILH